MPEKQKINLQRVNNIILNEHIRKDFFEQTKVDRYFLLNEADSLYLTDKQARLAKLLIKGLTSKQIAKIIGISHRTVEGNSSEIKSKLQDILNRALNKEQMIQLLRSSNLT